MRRLSVFCDERNKKTIKSGDMDFTTIIATRRQKYIIHSKKMLWYW